MTTSIEGVAFLSGTSNEPTIAEPGANTQLGKDAFFKVVGGSNAESGSTEPTVQ